MNFSQEQLVVDKQSCEVTIEQIDKQVKEIEDNGNLYFFRQPRQKRLGLAGGLMNRLLDAVFRLALTSGIVFCFAHLIRLGWAYQDPFVLPYMGFLVAVVGFSVLSARERNIVSRADHRFGAYDVWGITQFYDIFADMIWIIKSDGEREKASIRLIELDRLLSEEEEGGTMEATTPVVETEEGGGRGSTEEKSAPEVGVEAVSEAETVMPAEGSAIETEDLAAKAAQAGVEDAAEASVLDVAAAPQVVSDDVVPDVTPEETTVTTEPEGVGKVAVSDVAAAPQVVSDDVVPDVTSGDVTVTTEPEGVGKEAEAVSDKTTEQVRVEEVAAAPEEAKTVEKAPVVQKKQATQTKKVEKAEEPKDKAEK